jgi:diguanylate cyclase (GGDEF)-like protein
MKILIAEDDVVTLRILRASLEKWGYDVVAAETGIEAWDALMRNDIAIAILDWMMPGMDGIEVCRKARGIGDRDYVYIILLTAKEGKNDIVTGLDAGADDYMVKPFNKLELHSRIQVGERIVRLERRLQSALRKFEALSETDDLTQLCNHGTILKRLAEEMSRSQRENKPLSVIMADIDHFKRINDNYGHITGDHVLLEVAGKIKSVSRPYDVVGRYGGEEFLVILPNTDEKEARGIAERIHTCVRDNPVNLGSESVMVSISISVGVGTIPAAMEATSETIIRAVDAALYRAKDKGRNRVEWVTDEDFHKKPVQV